MVRYLLGQVDLEARDGLLEHAQLIEGRLVVVVDLAWLGLGLGIGLGLGLG